MLTKRLTASAIIGARTARACDGCMIRRARWFCASDDAFLCHSCDASVHSANQLASRHERVRISSSAAPAAAEPSKPAPLAISGSDWHQKVTRRARTPRSNGVKAKSFELKEASSLVVPEIGFEEELSCEIDEDEDLMVFQVPVFDSDCGFWNEDESASVEELHSLLDFVSDDIQFTAGDDEALIGVVNAEFLSDVDLEILHSTNGKKMNALLELETETNTRVKMEDDEIGAAVLASQYDTDLIDSCNRESLLDWDFGFESDEMAVKEEESLNMKVEGSGSGSEEVSFAKSMLLLKLNCDEVVSAWDEHSCPWMNGTRPLFDPLGDCWPQFSQGIKDSIGGHGSTEDGNGGRPVSGERVVNEERVARVSRYREKRRTRLFSKKIRYEVRKLNAEKRPRMKGRFCKRVQSYVGPQINILK